MDFGNRQYVTCTGGGSGDLTIDTVINAHTTLQSGYLPYTAFTSTQFEIGLGSVTDGVLTRNKIIASSNSNNIVNFTDPPRVFNSYHADYANSAYLFKQPINNTYTINQALTTALSNGTRVLLLNQTNPVENGIYVASSGNLVRPIDYYTGSSNLNAIIPSIDHNCLYIQSSGNVVDTDALTYTYLLAPDWTLDGKRISGVATVFPSVNISPDTEITIDTSLSNFFEVEINDETVITFTTVPGQNFQVAILNNGSYTPGSVIWTDCTIYWNDGTEIEIADTGVTEIGFRCIGLDINNFPILRAHRHGYFEA